MTTDHGAAGFCTDCGQAPDGRTETVAALWVEHFPGSARPWSPGFERLFGAFAAVVVAALDDESARLRERWQAVVSAPSFEAAVTAEAVAYHATECSYRADVVQLRDALMLANTTTRKAIDERDAARAALDRVRALADKADQAHHWAERFVWSADLRAALNPEEPR